MKYRNLSAFAILAALLRPDTHAADVPGSAWKVGAPIVSYWGGPGYPGGSELNDATATS
jgi:hypothetical protein